MNRIDDAMPAKLVALVAPAGYGKTTVAESWLHRRPDATSAGWLTLDEHDSDPVRFWRYLSECLLQLGVPIDRRLLQELRRDPNAVAELVVAIADGMADAKDSRIVVLDDLHRLGTSDVIDQLVRLIEAVPPETTMVVTSRVGLPWPSDRLHAAGGLVVLDQADLAFDRSEMAAMLAAIAPEIELDEREIDRVHTWTRGWPVVAQLAALALRRHPRRHDELLDVDLTGPAVARYLSEEVLTGLDPEMRSFLDDVSVCEWLTHDLAIAVAERPAGALLDRLVAEQLVVVSRDGGYETHRLHPLIRELVGDHLARDDPDRLRSLHRRAAAWHHAQVEPAAAIRHLLEAEAFNEAFDRIVDVTDEYWLAGREETLLRWLRALPTKDLEQRPEVAARLAMSLAMVGGFEEARGWLRVADRASQSDDDRMQVAPARIIIEHFSGHPAATLEAFAPLRASSGQTSGRPSTQDSLSESLFWVPVAAMAYELLGRSDERRAAMATAAWHVGAMGRVGEFSLGPLISMFKAEDGELETAKDYAQRALERAGERHLEFATLGFAHLALARIAWCEGRLPDAVAEVDEMDKIDPGPSVPQRLFRSICAAEVYASIGRHDLVDETLESAKRDEPNEQMSQTVRGLIAGWGLGLSATHGRQARARRWLAEMAEIGVELRLPSPIWARRELLLGRPDSVVQRFGRDGSRLPAEPLPRLRCGLVLVAALRTTGAKTAAQELAGPLLSHAEKHCLVRPVVEDDLLAKLLNSGLPGGPSRGFLDRIESGAAELALVNTVPGVAGPIERLTSREVDVLRLLPTRLSNRGIASELFVSVNTVKSHLRGIYRKLGVTTRDQATERARQLGLI